MRKALFLTMAALAVGLVGGCSSSQTDAAAPTNGQVAAPSANPAPPPGSAASQAPYTRKAAPTAPPMRGNGG
ncbi:MAG: hypothetical protein IT208_03480 [Chthonomonadales bacterium]|nr:hypothetical protein [Chthonomonadales bacterium]